MPPLLLRLTLPVIRVPELTLESAVRPPAFPAAVGDAHTGFANHAASQVVITFHLLAPAPAFRGSPAVQSRRPALVVCAPATAPSACSVLPPGSTPPAPVARCPRPPHPMSAADAGLAPGGHTGGS